VNCESFLDRLYDDDARAAGRGLGKIPPDMAAHMLACDRCRAAYDSAREDDRLMTRALQDVPSPAWRAAMLREVARSSHSPWSQRIATVNEAVIWGIVAVAASQVLLGDHSTAASVAAFWAGGTAALVRPSIAKHWQLIRRPLRYV
jgi:hypothetical protein